MLVSLTPRQQAVIVVIGLATVLTIGIVGCMACILGLVWLMVHLTLMTVQACIEVTHAIGSTYTAADPLTQFLMVLVVLLAIRHLWVTRKGVRHAA